MVKCKLCHELVQNDVAKRYAHAFGHHGKYGSNDHKQMFNQIKSPVDPLIQAAKKAYRNSEPGKLQKLLDDESRWKRKFTIAQNKLADARQAVNDYARELADRCMKEGK